MPGIFQMCTQIASKKWRVDLHSKQEVSLQLSAVHLPGGVQRRRTAEDELAMRDIFTEGDLISVRLEIRFDLHTVFLQLFLYCTKTMLCHRLRCRRSSMMGPWLCTPDPGVSAGYPQACSYASPMALWNAKSNTSPQLRSSVRIPSHHPHHPTPSYGAGVDMVLGVNGWIWIGPHNPQFHDLAGPDMLASTEAPALPAPIAPPSDAQLLAVAHAASAVSVLGALFFPIHPATLVTVVAIAQAQHTAPRDMLSSDFLTLVVDAEVQRRQQMQQVLLNA